MLPSGKQTIISNRIIGPRHTWRKPNCLKSRAVLTSALLKGGAKCFKKILQELTSSYFVRRRGDSLCRVCFEEQSIWARMEGTTAQSALEQFAIRPLFLGWSACAWCFGAAWNSFSRPYRTRLRTDFLACSDCSTRSLS
jgi:hypothetical protein